MPRRCCSGCLCHSNALEAVYLHGLQFEQNYPQDQQVKQLLPPVQLGYYQKITAACLP